MADKFTQEDLYQRDIYGNLRESIESLITPLRSATAEAVKFHAEVNQTAQQTTNSARGIRDLTQANQQSKEIMEQKLKIDK